MENMIYSQEWSFIVDVDHNVKIQTKLNQWRHSYDIIIVTCIPVDERTTYLAIWRRERQ